MAEKHVILKPINADDDIHALVSIIHDGGKSMELTESKHLISVFEVLERNLNYRHFR